MRHQIVKPTLYAAPVWRSPNRLLSRARPQGSSARRGLVLLASAPALAVASCAGAEPLGAEQARIIMEQAVRELAEVAPDLGDDLRLRGAAGATSGQAAFAMAPTKALPGPHGALGPAGGLLAACASLGDMPEREGKPRLNAGAYLIVIRKAGKKNWAAYYIDAFGKVAASTPVAVSEVETTVPVAQARVEWEGQRLRWVLRFPSAAGKAPVAIACDLLARASITRSGQSSSEEPTSVEKPHPEQKKTKKKGKKKGGP